jgi:hypothetical protein
VKRLFRLGFVVHLSLVVLISVGAYAGVLPTSVPDVPHLDWLGHAILIGGLAFFLDGALDHRSLMGAPPAPQTPPAPPPSPWPLRKGIAFPRLGPAIVIAAAGIEEYLQRLSPRRSSDLGDFLADVVGVCFFSWLSRRVVEARYAPQ